MNSQAEKKFEKSEDLLAKVSGHQDFRIKQLRFREMCAIVFGRLSPYYLEKRRASLTLGGRTSRDCFDWSAARDARRKWASGLEQLLV